MRERVSTDEQCATLALMKLLAAGDLHLVQCCMLCAKDTVSAQDA
jgi:hypothetical protein